MHWWSFHHMSQCPYFHHSYLSHFFFHLLKPAHTVTASLLPSAIIPSFPFTHPCTDALYNAWLRRNSIGVVHIHVLTTDLTAEVRAGVRYWVAGRETLGTCWKSNKSIRQCPPVTSSQDSSFAGNVSKIHACI